MTEATLKQPAAIRTGNLRTPVLALIAISVTATLFLLWLIYVHIPPSDYATRLLFLPRLNAILNSLSAISLSAGFFFITRRQVGRHRAMMSTAFVLSSVFLVSYILNHALHGDTHYPGHSTVRVIYLAILASHVLLSMAALPMVLITFFFSLSGRFPQHRRIARFTFPIWLYVSVTGVVVYAMLGSALGRY